MNEINAVLPDVRLRFNIEHPSIEECYIHGYESALSGEMEESNPYPLNSTPQIQWSEGWWAGFYGEAPLFGELMSEADDELPANDAFYHGVSNSLWTKWAKITGAIAVSAVVGYQILDMVA